MVSTSRVFSSGIGCRVFDKILFMIFAKHETHENAPVFRETFANFARSKFSRFSCFVKVMIFVKLSKLDTTEHARGFKKSGEIENNQCVYSLFNT